MTYKEKAKELVDFCIKYSDDVERSKQDCAIILADKICNEIISALEDYGENTDELQNMDRELNWWYSVREEVWTI